MTRKIIYFISVAKYRNEDANWTASGFLKGGNMKDLLLNFLIAKSNEDAAREGRIAAEEAIIAKMGNLKLEGTTTKEVENYKVAVTTKLTRTLDYDKYIALDLPSSLRFVDFKPTINLTAYRAALLVNPTIALCVTSKPAKTSVKVEVIE